MEGAPNHKSCYPIPNPRTGSIMVNEPLPVPEDHLKDLPHISACEIRGMINKGEVHIENKAIHGDALGALHEAIIQDIPVSLEECRIDGDLNFTNFPSIPLTREVVFAQEVRQRLQERGIGELILVRGLLEIEGSFISGRVMSGFPDNSKSVVFSEVAFLGTTFREGASFEGAVFGDKADFFGVNFGGVANFGHATFGDGPRFEMSYFGDKARFEYVTFSDGASFSFSKFRKEAWFWKSTFGERAKFGGTSFYEEAHLWGATFGDGVSFWGATFGKMATFFGTTFKGAASFEGLKEPLPSREEGEEPEAIAERWKLEIGSLAGEKILVFSEEVAFNRVSFEVPSKVIFQYVNLRQARFLETPIDKIQFIDVEWAEREGRNCLFDEIVDEPNEKDYALIAHLYRQLKKNYEEKRAYPEAGDFHYGEMEIALKQHMKNWKKEWFSWLITWAYKVLSGYGEKPRRTVGWAITILLIPAICYSLGKITVGKDSVALGFLDCLLRSLGYMTFRISQAPNELWAKILMFAQAILGPIQLAIVALAFHRKFRR